MFDQGKIGSCALQNTCFCKCQCLSNIRQIQPSKIFHMFPTAPFRETAYPSDSANQNLPFFIFFRQLPSQKVHIHQIQPTNLPYLKKLVGRGPFSMTIGLYMSSSFLSRKQASSDCCTQLLWILLSFVYPLNQRNTLGIVG